MKSLGFTGTANGTTAKQSAILADMLYSEYVIGAELHHGDCLGADAEAHKLAETVGYATHVHPPSNRKVRAFCVGTVVYAAKPYLLRNWDIVRASQKLIATPAKRHETQRSGTWTTIRYARKFGIPILIILPNGEIRREPD